MSESNEYIVSLEQLVRLRDAGSLTEAEFTQERANLLNLHRVAGEPKPNTREQLDEQPVDFGGGAPFFISYIVFMIPTYVLPYLGSNSIVANGLWSAVGMGFLPQFWLHVLALYALVVICWTRGARIRVPWLPVFPALAAVFDLVPILSWIPLVPTGCHVAALIIGVSRPAVESPAFTRGRNFAGFAGFVAIAAYGLLYPAAIATRTVAQVAAPSEIAAASEDEPVEFTSETTGPVSDAAAYEVSEPAKISAADAGSPEPSSEVIVVGDPLDVATHKALNFGKVTAWREGDRSGTVTPSTEVAISGSSCRTAVIAEGDSRLGSISTTWCRTEGRPWERR